MIQEILKISASLSRRHNVPEDEIIYQLYKKYKKKKEKNISLNYSYLYQAGVYICYAYYNKNKKNDIAMECLDKQVMPENNFDEIIAGLSKTAQEILTAKFVSQMNFTQISQDLDLPYSKVLEIYKKSIEFLKREYISM